MFNNIKKGIGMQVEKDGNRAASGYLGICRESGKFIPFEKAYDYALERCLRGTPEDQREFREMLVEWFYSENWVKE